MTSPEALPVDNRWPLYRALVIEDLVASIAVLTRDAEPQQKMLAQAVRITWGGAFETRSITADQFVRMMTTTVKRVHAYTEARAQEKGE